MDEVAVPGVIGGGDIGIPGVEGHCDRAMGNVALRGEKVGDRAVMGKVALRGVKVGVDIVLIGESGDT